MPTINNYAQRIKKLMNKVENGEAIRTDLIKRYTQRIERLQGCEVCEYKNTCCQT